MMKPSLEKNDENEGRVCRWRQRGNEKSIVNLFLINVDNNLLFFKFRLRYFAKNEGTKLGEEILEFEITNLDSSGRKASSIVTRLCGWTIKMSFGSLVKRLNCKLGHLWLCFLSHTAFASRRCGVISRLIGLALHIA